MAGTLELKVRVARPGVEVESALRSVAGVSAVLKTDAGYTVNVLGTGDAAIEKVAEAAVMSKSGLLELRKESADLEDIFLKLTTSEENQKSGIAAAGGVA